MILIFFTNDIEFLVST